MLSCGADQLALLQVEGAVSDCSCPRIMGDHDDGLMVVAGQGAEELEDCPRRFSVEVASGLVCDKQPRIMDDSPGDGDSLFLPSGKLGWAMMNAIGETDEFERCFDPGPSFGPSKWLQKKR